MFDFVPMPLAFITALAALASALIPVAAVAVGAWGIIESRSQAKKAASTAKKVAGIQAAAQSEYAGEYFDLSKRQMELQSEQRQIDTLADLIKSKGETGPQILTTSPVTEYSILDQINQAIDRLLRR